MGEDKLPNALHATHCTQIIKTSLAARSLWPKSPRITVRNP
jgi:hypothetical protein